MTRFSIAGVIPHYQPIVRLADNKIIMYECLARFIGFNGDGIGPTDIEHLFDDQEFLWELLQKTVPCLINHINTYNTVITINIDAYTLGERFFYYFEHLFYKYPNCAKNIHFEITEKNIAKRLDYLEGYVKKIQEFGSKAVLDDFGTGGANIEIVSKIRFDYVKIDGQFLTGAVKSDEGLKRLQLIVELLKSYQTTIVGEHIESEEIADIAHMLGIEFGQGHYFGYPSPMIIQQMSNEFHEIPKSINFS